MEDDAFEGDLGLAERPQELTKLPSPSTAGETLQVAVGCLDASGVHDDEVSSLQSELDICRRLLNAKYLAAHILLKQQLVRVSEEKEEGTRQSHRQCAELLKELNGLQYELQCMEEHLRRSQQAWLDRLNSLVRENSDNLETLRVQGEALKRLTYTAQVLRRERDELLALTDVKERDVYLQPATSARSPLELAALAACACRGPRQEPCRCAHAAAHKQRQLAQLIERTKRLEAETRDSAKTADIYREAFEVQLARNRTLTRRLAQMQSRRDLLGALLTKRHDRGLVDDLVENLCDKNEALVHQQVMVKLLALQLGHGEQV
ncbi:coiled-coil domain-containing protein 125 isoform X2 [Rhipicephalus sanguineus]|uniref:coiled-coil domain-containing protein 125 isoform X2 n=1 Tax=Rhipicephalus sanguineus TaxID=34632 RepID=UPI00189532B9|nr:coiled-coil domain-containing protein 125 isoform X2 [Rhipicephalus sanguineus]